MEYTGKHRIIKNSRVCGEDVSVLEYKSDSKIPWCDCSRCGKPIVKRMFVIQSCETDIELLYLGSECIKRFS